MSAFCRWFWHDGDVIGEGRVIVTEKKNKEQRPLPGTWRVRKCRRCGEVYSTAEDHLRVQTVS